MTNTMMVIRSPSCIILIAEVNFITSIVLVHVVGLAFLAQNKPADTLPVSTHASLQTEEILGSKTIRCEYGLVF